MKNNKKLVVIAGAVALGLVAATGVTSGFAWFAVNNTVTATGMTVTAKSDAIFLEIKGKTNSADENYSGTGTNVVNAQLEPVAHETWSALDDIEDFDLNNDKVNDNWYHMTAAGPDNAAAPQGAAKTYISSFDGYVAKSQYGVKLHAGSPAAYDLYVKSVTLPVDDDGHNSTGIRLIVAGANGYKEFNASNANIQFNADDILSDTVTVGEQTITAYLYIDGTDSNVYTSNIAALTGSVSFTLAAFNTDQNPA